MTARTPVIPETTSAPAPTNLALTLQLLEWIERQPRTYRETMAGWQTHCPRFTILEDANSLGLVRTTRRRQIPDGVEVILTDAGRAFLAEHR